MAEAEIDSYGGFPADVWKLAGEASWPSRQRSRIEAVANAIMTDRASRSPDPSCEMLVEALRRIASTLTYPVSTEIDPRGWRLHSPNEDRNTFAAETAIEASHDRS